MKYEVNKYKDIYNDTYKKIENYNFHNLVKDMYVDVYAAYINGRILDAGCGEGIHLKRMLQNGHDAYGIELSSVCCDKFLKNVPHSNTDILSFSKTKEHFDGLICMDVLEHIPYESIDETIDALTKLSQCAFFGIANHSDILNGVELHLIQKDHKWWESILKKYYDEVYFFTDQFNGLFYYFYCSNLKNTDEFYLSVNKIIKYAIEIDNSANQLKDIVRVKDLEIADYEKRLTSNDVLINEKDNIISNISINNDMLNEELNSIKLINSSLSNRLDKYEKSIIVKILKKFRILSVQ